MRTIIFLIAMIIQYFIGFAVCYVLFIEPQKQLDTETLPTQVTDMFTVQGDTIYLKQDADFVISTRGIDIDTAGIIHRKNLHK